jgi:alpha-beta hydrolase superfamily lysophospholipase
MWPVLRKSIDEQVRHVEDFFSKKSGGRHRVTVRFFVGGHSQGAGLATLAALSLAKAYPSSPVQLVTFASPAIFATKEQADATAAATHVRHTRVSVQGDPVVSVLPLLAGRAHFPGRELQLVAPDGMGMLHRHTQFDVLLDELVRSGDAALIVDSSAKK